MSRVADTSFLMAAFDENDPRMPEAHRLLEDPESILILPEVLAETLGVTQHRYGFKRAETTWRDLASLPHIVWAEAPARGLVEMEFLRGKGRLSWVDAAVVAQCRDLGQRALAFDARIEEALFPGRLSDKK